MIGKKRKPAFGNSSFHLLLSYSLKRKSSCYMPKKKLHGSAFSKPQRKQFDVSDDPAKQECLQQIERKRIHGFQGEGVVDGGDGDFPDPQHGELSSVEAERKSSIDAYSKIDEEDYFEITDEERGWKGIFYWETEEDYELSKPFWRREIKHAEKSLREHLELAKKKQFKLSKKEKKEKENALSQLRLLYNRLM